jgi:hypothetical protein
MKLLALLLALAFCAQAAFAQQSRRHEGGRPPQHQMSQEERQRMRQDMREVYRERPRERAVQERPRQMSPAQRERLRRDVDDANRNLGRR